MEKLAIQKNAVKWLRIIYPFWAVVGMFSLMYVPSQLIDVSNPDLTASNISSNELLFRLGIVGSLITQLFSIGTIWFLFQLFYEDFKSACQLMAAFTFLGIPIAMVSTANQLAVLEVLGSPDQVILFLKLNSRGTMIATIFWGLWLLPLGYMIIKSPLFPRLIGWVVIAAGVGYTFNAFAYFLNFKGAITEVMEYLTFGEVLWMLYVLILGARWKMIKQ